jgi:hypothetical protein
MMQWPDGRVRPLLFDGSPLLSSAVLFGVDGHLHTGRDAAHLGRGNPERLEPYPKRRIDDDVVLLGPAEVLVRDLLAAVLGRVAVEAWRVAGQLGDVTLTHPAAWGPRRCALLVEAAERAGLGRVRLVAEPVAAATYFEHTMLEAFPPGSRVVVYDLGAGTCDITVLRRGPYGFDLVACDGLNDVGGLDVDAAIVAFLEATYGRLWTGAVSRRQVWEEVRGAKEMLSRTSGTVIAIPALSKEAPLGREQFDGLIGPVLRPTIALARSLIRDTAGAAAPGAPTAVVLVGGASRIPLVATLLTEATGTPPIVIEQPELVVAEGALHPTPVAAAGAGTDAVPGGTGGAPAGAPVSGAGGPVAPKPGPAAAVSGPGGTAAPAVGISSPAGPVIRGTQAPAESTSGPGGPAAAGAVPDGNGLAPDDPAPGNPAPGDGPAPARSGRPRAVVAAVVVGVLLAGVIGLLKWMAADNSGASGQPTATTSHPGGARSASGTPAPGKYAMAVLDEKLCTKVALGKLGTTYSSQSREPISTRAGNSSIGTTTCSISRRSQTQGSLSITVIAVVYAFTNQAVSSQKLAFDAATDTDPNVMTLTGIGEEAFATRAETTAVPWEMAYTADARDSNLRLEVLGITDIRTPSDEQMRQFARDLGEVAKSAIATLASG